MELSPDENIHDLNLDKNKTYRAFIKGRNLDCDTLNEVLDLSKIQFEDDESWLCRTSPIAENQVQNLKHWLHSSMNCSHDELFSSNVESDSQKNFDSRTFTRPKKRFTRPSIEKYNEYMYGGDHSNNLTSSRESLSGISSSNTTKLFINETPKSEVTRPLSFDLSQPSNSYYFENMLANIKDTDSFQNMSPPSLVNSICSTTFANLMENSFIKNDPVLREIRDTDFTESILLQDSEAPMFHSITESCSSLNSDTPESFLKKVSRSDTFKKKSSFDLMKSTDTDDLSNTFQVNTTLCLDDTYNTEMFDEANNGSVDLDKTICLSTNVNETYLHTPKKESFNSTKPLLIKRSLIRENTIEDLKKQLNEPVQITDINRLSYCLDDKAESVLNETHQVNKNVDIKRSSISTGSNDSLDRMSSISNSSRGSNRMLSMADVDAIVEMQEKSLHQVMSTPKVNTVPKKFLVNNFISPITSHENLSDSDLSSSEDYKSVRSSLSRASLDSYGQSRHYLGGNDTRTMSMQTPQQKSYKTNVPKNSSDKVRSRQITNDTIVHSGSKSNMEAPVTNLKLMGQKLKASYTSLKPMSTNLPVVPPLNVTKTLTRPKKSAGSQNFDAHAKVVEVPPMPRERVVDNHVFMKPANPKSSLPRPTGIPRPSSRIPAPRSGIRPASSRYSNAYETRESYQ